MILKDYFNKKNKEKFDKYTDTLLYMAARNEHLVNKIIPALRIIEMDKVCPLHEKCIKVNDIIIGINQKESNWNNLTQSLRFATLGENLILEFYTFSDKFKTHEFKYAEEKT